MKLNECMDKYRITATQMGARLGLSSTTIYMYLSGRRKPTQKRAEMIEKELDGLVTVFDLRGKDARRKS